LCNIFSWWWSNPFWNGCCWPATLQKIKLKNLPGLLDDGPAKEIPSTSARSRVTLEWKWNKRITEYSVYSIVAASRAGWPAEIGSSKSSCESGTVKFFFCCCCARGPLNSSGLMAAPNCDVNWFTFPSSYG
jgi:hypothetical protein